MDLEAGLMLLGFVTLLRSCEFVCIGREVQGYRMTSVSVSGFQTLLLCLLLVPALLAHDVSLEIVTAKYFQLMTATILLALLAAVGAFAASYQQHTKHPVTGALLPS